jgi:acyl-CoA synthetase (AMP-forming)/AMP-acid ligase II
MMRRDPSGWDIRWDAARATDYAASGAWPGRTMAQYAEDLLRRAADRVIVVDAGREWTVQEIHERARRLAGALRARGLKPGDRISYQLPNWAETTVIDMAATLAGLVVNPLVPIYREAEVGFMMSDCGSRMIFIPAQFRNHDYRATLRKVLRGLPHPVEVVVLRGDAEEFLAFEDLVSAGEPLETPAQVSPDDVKMVLYTSGTTGRAKAVLHSHNTVGALAHQFMQHMHISDADVILVCSPVTHITGAIQAFQLTWATGAQAVMMETWSGDLAVELITRHGVTFSAGAAPFIVDLLAAAESSGERLPTLRSFVAGGSTIPESLGKQVYERFPNCALFRAYGCTEVPTATSGEPDRSQMRLNIGSDGAPVGMTELRIVHPETGEPVAAGQEGEILLRGPQSMLGYLRPDENAAAFDAEGFFRTGDLGRFVEGAWIEISGRWKDIIIRAGENLSPKEIEDALTDHPAVASVAIVAKPSPRTGEAACAFVVPKPGAAPALADFAAFLIDRGFAKQKLPEHLVLVDSLPMTAAGKVQKHILREQAKSLS